MTDELTTWRMTRARTQRLPGGTTYADHGPHWLLVVEGAARLEAGGAIHHLWPGDAVLVAARHDLEVTTRIDTILAVSDLAMVVPTHPLPAVTVARRFGTRQSGVAALVKLCPMATRCGPPLMSASYAHLVGAAMLSVWLEDEGLTPGTDPERDPVVATVVAAVTERPGEDWSVERMADLVHLSRSALGERFRRALSRSPAEVLRDARMHEARRLLQGGEPTVEQVAHAVGYGSAAAFSRAFSAQHGVSPQAWRTESGRRSGPRGPERGEGQPAGRGEGRAQRESRHDTVRVDERTA